MRTAKITIDTSALTHNLNQVQQRSPTSRILAMIKADAYGHGVESCLAALTSADAIGVATFDEARQARLLGWSKSIVMIEGAFSVEEWRRCQIFEISCVAHHQAQIDWALSNVPTDNSPSRTIWLKVNTGMNRLGFEPNQIIPIAKQLYNAGYPIVLTSHFANADVKAHPLNQQQISTFKHLLTHLHKDVCPNIEASLCNSAGLIHFPEYHYDWVRPGIMLYGSSPIANQKAQELNLRSVMCFASILMAIQPLSVGVSVGYGSLYTTSHNMVKGIVSVGYGDGYPRVVNITGCGAWVSLHQADGSVYACSIIGRVSMDMIAIDLTDVPNPTIGSRVVLWGDDKQGCPHVDDIAASSGTIGYELLCRLSQRPSRHVI